MGKLRVYCIKTLNKLSIYPLGNTPSTPSDNRDICWTLWSALLRNTGLGIDLEIQCMVQRLIGVLKLGLGPVNLEGMTSVFLQLERSEPMSWGPAFGRLPLCLSLQPKRPWSRYLVWFLPDSNPQLGFSALLGILGWSAGVWVSMGAGHVVAYVATGLR